MKDSRIVLMLATVLPILGMAAAYCLERDTPQKEADKPAMPVVLVREPAAALPIAPKPEVRVNRLLRAVFYTESHNNPAAVSAKGARGLCQTMPMTARKPGFGVKRLQNDSVKEQQRFCGDYLNAMLREFDGNITLGLMAYNWGAHNVEKWLDDGGNPKMIPQETKDYVFKVNVQLAMNEE